MKKGFKRIVAMLCVVSMIVGGCFVAGGNTSKASNTTEQKEWTVVSQVGDITSTENHVGEIYRRWSDLNFQLNADKTEDDYMLYIKVYLQDDDAKTSMMKTYVELANESDGNGELCWLPAYWESNGIETTTGVNELYLPLNKFADSNTTGNSNFDVAKTIKYLRIRSAGVTDCTGVILDEIKIIDVTPVVQEYTGAKATVAPTENIPEDFVFAGWYTNKACTSVLSGETTGTAYAKFVKEEVLSLKTQYATHNNNTIANASGYKFDRADISGQVQNPALSAATIGDGGKTVNINYKEMKAIEKSAGAFRFDLTHSGLTQVDLSTYSLDELAIEFWMRSSEDRTITLSGTTFLSVMVDGTNFVTFNSGSIKLKASEWTKVTMNLGDAAVSGTVTNSSVFTSLRFLIQGLGENTTLAVSDMKIIEEKETGVVGTLLPASAMGSINQTETTEGTICYVNKTASANGTKYRVDAFGDSLTAVDLSNYQLKELALEFWMKSSVDKTITIDNSTNHLRMGVGALGTNFATYTKNLYFTGHTITLAAGEWTKVTLPLADAINQGNLTSSAQITWLRFLMMDLGQGTEISISDMKIVEAENIIANASGYKFDRADISGQLPDPTLSTTTIQDGGKTVNINYKEMIAIEKSAGAFRFDLNHSGLKQVDLSAYNSLDDVAIEFWIKSLDARTITLSSSTILRIMVDTSNYVTFNSGSIKLKAGEWTKVTLNLGDAAVTGTVNTSSVFTSLRFLIQGLSENTTLAVSDMKIVEVEGIIANASGYAFDRADIAGTVPAPALSKTFIQDGGNTVSISYKEMTAIEKSAGAFRFDLNHSGLTQVDLSVYDSFDELAIEFWMKSLDARTITLSSSTILRIMVDTSNYVTFNSGSIKLKAGEWTKVTLNLGDAAVSGTVTTSSVFKSLRFLVQGLSEDTTLAVSDMKIVEVEHTSKVFLGDYADLRFVTTVDSINYTNVGFEITIGEKTSDKYSNKVYGTLHGVSGDATITYTPDVFTIESEYFKAHTLTNIPETAFDTEIKVRPFWTTQDGTKVFGTQKTCTVNGEIAANENATPETDLRVVFSSDIHYTAYKPDDYENSYHGINPDTRMQYWVDCITAEHQKDNIDLLILNGDFSLDYTLMKSGLFPDWVVVANEKDMTQKFINTYLKQITDLGIEVFVMPGNHELYADSTWLTMTGNNRQGFKVVGNNLFICLDNYNNTSNPPETIKSDGNYTNTDTQYINQLMQEYPNHDVYLVAHNFELYKQDGQTVSDTGLQQLLATDTDNRIKALIDGHGHEAAVRKLGQDWNNKISVRTGNFSYSLTVSENLVRFWGFRELIITEDSAYSQYINVASADGCNVEGGHKRTTSDAVWFY